MMLKKLQYIGTRIYSLDTMYPKKETDRDPGWEIGRKKERKEKRNKKPQFSQAFFSSVSCAGSLALSTLLFPRLFMAFSTTCLDWSLSLHLCVHGSSVFAITAHPSKSFSAFLSGSVPLPFSVSLHLSSVLLSLSLSLFLSLYLSACLLYHLSCLF